jgi:hypothetical protein
MRVKQMPDHDGKQLTDKDLLRSSVISVKITDINGLLPDNSNINTLNGHER